MKSIINSRRTSAAGGAVELVVPVGASKSGLTVTTNVGNKTFTRSGGSWLTDGFAVGDVVWFFGFTAGAAPMNGAAFTVVGLTALVMTVSEAVQAVTDAPNIECHVAERDVDTNIIVESISASYSVAPAANVAVQLRDKSGVLWQGFWRGNGGERTFRGGFSLLRGRSVRVSHAAGGGAVVVDVGLAGKTL